MSQPMEVTPEQQEQWALCDAIRTGSVSTGTALRVDWLVRVIGVLANMERHITGEPRLPDQVADAYADLLEAWRRHRDRTETNSR